METTKLAEPLLTTVPVHPLREARAEFDARRVVVAWYDGRCSAFHFIWLRDNLPEMRLNGNQRLADAADIPPDVEPSQVAVDERGDLEVKWRHDGRVSRFSADWLRAHDYGRAAPEPPRVFWDARSAARLPVFDHERVRRDPEALAGWLAGVRDFGLARLSGVPPREGALEGVVSLFGLIRETNYGRVYDVRYRPDPENLADSAMALTVHTDNPYRRQVPEVQLLHCLESDIAGGDSQFVDGFHAAERLRREAPALFDVLAAVPVRFRYATREVVLEAEAPLIALDPAGRVTTVRFNNRSMAPLRATPEKVLPFYEAYRAFHQILTAPSMRLEFRMRPGDLVVMDNRRVLHGRGGYSSAGKRHLRGCYCDIDGLLSRLAVLERHKGTTP